MNSKLQNLKDLLKENPAAAEKAKAIPDGKPEEMKDALMSLAKEYGILLEDSDFQSEEEELSLESLDAVAGGAGEKAFRASGVFPQGYRVSAGGGGSQQIRAYRLAGIPDGQGPGGNCR